ncbi:MAG: dienelactone hydrolase family protein [Chloroflexi bacterium]|nr:dienelactone hydrolase family protein [Chloroflexota bacterium]
MCVPYDSRPPVQPISGAAVSTRDLTLTSKDGARFAAFLASGGRPGTPGVVVLPDVRGLFHFYEELAVRFAERGYDSIAIDYFGRTGGVSKRDEQFPFMDHVAKTKVDQINADVGSAVAELRIGQGNANRPLFTVGFCFGGSNSWIQATAGHGLKGAIGFYGNPTRQQRDGTVPVIDRVKDIKCPILGLMGGADQGIPVEEVEKFRTALAQNKVQHEIHVYPGAPHSFFDRRFADFRKECDDAWQKVIGFIEKNSR